MTTAKEKAAETANSATDVAKSYLYELGEKAQDVAGDVADKTSKAVKGNPLKSVAIAAGVGFLLGLWCKR